jgi:hypothetical protein
MNDRNDVTRLTPAEEDPLLHQYLAQVPAFAPGPSFGNHVLSRVWRPEPEWVRNVRFFARDLVDTGRIWLLIGAVTFGSLIPLAVLLGSGAVFSAELGAGIDWLFNRGIPAAWTATLDDISVALSPIRTQLAAVPLSGEVLRIVAVGSIPVFALCAWGLSRTMRAKVRH